MKVHIVTLILLSIFLMTPVLRVKRQIYLLYNTYIVTSMYGYDTVQTVSLLGPLPNINNDMQRYRNMLVFYVIVQLYTIVFNDFIAGVKCSFALLHGARAVEELRQHHSH